MAKKKKQQERKPKPEPKPEPKPPKPVPPKPKPKPNPRPMRKEMHTGAACILAATLLAAGFVNREAFENWAVQTTQVSTGAATWCARLDGQQAGLGTLTNFRYLSCAYDTIDGPLMNAITSEVASIGFRIVGARLAKQAVMGVEDGGFVENGPLLIEAAETWRWLWPHLRFPFCTASLMEMARNFALGEPDLLTQLDLDRIACPNCNWGWETVDGLLNGLIEGQLDKISGMAFSNRLQDALKLLRLAIVCLKLLKAVKEILERAKRAEALEKASDSAEATDAHQKGLQEVRTLVLRQKQEVRDALNVASWPSKGGAGAVLAHVVLLEGVTVSSIKSRAAAVRIVLTGTDDASFIKDCMMIGKGGGVGKGDACVHVGGGPYVEGVRKSYKLELAVHIYDREKEGLRVINRDRVEMFDELKKGPLEVVLRIGACTASRALGGVALLCSPENPLGLMQFNLREADIIKSDKIVVDRAELDSPLVLAVLTSRLAVLSDLGRLVNGAPPLDELGLDEDSVQGQVRYFCRVTGHKKEALFASSAYEIYYRREGSSDPFTFVSRGKGSTVFARYPVLANPSDLEAAPRVEDGVSFCGVPVADLWRDERARARTVHVAEKTSLRWARDRDDRSDWARAALLEADTGDVAPFICLDRGLGVFRNVRVAVVLPGTQGGRNCKDALMHDDRFRDQINKLCRAGAVVVGDNTRDPSDVLLVSEDINLRDRIQCMGLTELQERGRVLLWDPFAAEALAASTAVLGEDEASVALREKHAIFWRTPKTGSQRTDQKPADVVDGILRVPLGSSHSFRVHPDVLEASDRRAAARLDASRGSSGRRRRGR